MADIYPEYKVVLVRKLIEPQREIDGTSGALHQPRVGDQAVVVSVLEPEHRILECVDSSGRTRWVAEFHIDEIVEPPDNWSFQIVEVSPCVYRASGTGPRGMHAESTDTDPDKALADCREFALR